MKPFDSIEYNKLCAEFLNWSYGHPDKSETRWSTDWFDNNGVRHSHLQFDSDYNWIMEVIEKIQNIRREVKEYGVLEWFEVHLYSHGCLIKSGLNHADGETKSPYYYSNSVWKSNCKEAVVQAIWEFLNWYNEQSKTINKWKTFI
jgi:hypothetical protein